ncbi:MAG: hypothetical protein Aureis2KO_10320 [Aureisphaera sp.]
MDKYQEYDQVQKCLALIEDQLGWGDSKSWHNDVFIELSEKIQEQTQVLLSPTTLKRVWGKVSYSNAPSISTLNTLAQFAGFLNWRDFKNNESIKKPSFISKRISPNLGIIVGSAALMTILFISLYSMIGSPPVLPADYSKIEFKSRPIALGLPNSVVFDLNLTGITSDSIYIQQYWDPTKTIQITKEQEQATGQYYYPGYFRAKLVVDGQIIREHSLFIKSEGWLGTIDYDPVPKYISANEIQSDKLSYSSGILEEIKSSEKPLGTSFHYLDDLPSISGDGFTLSTSLRNVYRDKWAVCQQSSIVVVGTKSAFIIPFSISGCVSELGVMISDSYLDGKKHDLSAFGSDFSDFKDVKISVKDKRVEVYMDDNAIFSHAYTKSIGEVVGIRFRFLGAGEIDYLKLQDANGNTVFDDDFGSRID